MSEEAIEEFKQIYFQEEGILLSDVEASEKANLIFELFVDLQDVVKVSNNET